MTECTNCGTKLGFFNSGSGGLCSKCHSALLQANIVTEEYPTRAEMDAADADRASQEAEIKSVLLTTETVVNLVIRRRIDIVTAECAFGMNLFKDILVNVRDIVGGRSETLQSSMRQSRQLALDELRREAYLLGANAVVGVNLAYTAVTGSGSNMIMLVASGTAVEIEV